MYKIAKPIHLSRVPKNVIPVTTTCSLRGFTNPETCTSVSSPCYLIWKGAVYSRIMVRDILRHLWTMLGEKVCDIHQTYSVDPPTTSYPLYLNPSVSSPTHHSQLFSFAGWGTGDGCTAHGDHSNVAVTTQTQSSVAPSVHEAGHHEQQGQATHKTSNGWMEPVLQWTQSMTHGPQWPPFPTPPRFHR